MSSAKKPPVSSPRSPRSSQMQNVVPSRIVSVTAAGYTCDTTRRMAEDAERHALRATFDEGAEQYDDARPVAPAEVFDDLVELARLAPGDRVLEIGCGTGKADASSRRARLLDPRRRARREPRRARAPEARRRIPEVEIVTSSFEDWEPGGELFDAVVSFNAFHWLDPEVAVLEARVRAAAGRIARRVRLALRRPRRCRPGRGSALQEDHEAVARRLRATTTSTTSATARTSSRRAGTSHRHPKAYLWDSHVRRRRLRRAARNDVDVPGARGRRARGAVRAHRGAGSRPAAARSSRRGSTCSTSLRVA